MTELLTSPVLAEKALTSSLLLLSVVQLSHCF